MLSDKDKNIYKLDLNALNSLYGSENDKLYVDKNIYKLDLDTLNVLFMDKKLYDNDNKYNKEDVYNNMIKDIIHVSKLINLNQTSKKSDNKDDRDGRIESAIKEEPFLIELKRRLLDKNPNWNIVICEKRCSCDIIINSIRINLKLTDCRTADNSVNKSAIYYSITGDCNYPYSSTWNDFLERLMDSKNKGLIKKERDVNTEYHYLVKNKKTGDVLLKSIFDIHKYISNPSNDLQINWKNEFKNIEYRLDKYNVNEYHKKIQSLLECIQESVRKMIERNKKFAESDLSLLFL